MGFDWNLLNSKYLWVTEAELLSWQPEKQTLKRWWYWFGIKRMWFEFVVEINKNKNERQGISGSQQYVWQQEVGSTYILNDEGKQAEIRIRIPAFQDE